MGLIKLKISPFNFKKNSDENIIALKFPGLGCLSVPLHLILFTELKLHQVCEHSQNCNFKLFLVIIS